MGLANVGAYGMSLSSNYNTRPIIAEIMVNGSKDKIIRKRQTLESLVNKPNVKLINLGSSCIYPLGVEVPIKEESLMTGKLEPTNSPYAMAKLTAIEIGDAIKKEHPAVEIESSTENDSRLERLPVNRRSRLPVIIYYKNDVYASHILGKRDYQEVQRWFNTLGINA